MKTLHFLNSLFLLEHEIFDLSLEKLTEQKVKVLSVSGKEYNLDSEVKTDKDFCLKLLESWVKSVATHLPNLFDAENKSDFEKRKAFLKDKKQIKLVVTCLNQFNKFAKLLSEDENYVKYIKTEAIQKLQKHVLTLIREGQILSQEFDEQNSKNSKEYLKNLPSQPLYIKSARKMPPFRVVI